MPNVEHAKKTQKRLLKSTHTLIAKTRAAFNIFTDYFKHDRGRAPRIVYIGHSSVDPLVHFGNNLPEKNFENVFHAYGHAGTKGTVELVKCWARHPEWPTLTVVGNKNDDKIPFGFNDPDNIVFYNKVGHEELGVLHSEAAIHVYPTSREGFGHALNEARGSGALLVTTNFGPMDEFVHEGYSGFLIDIKYENVEDFQLFGEFMPVQAHVDSEAICNSMEKLLKKSLTERRRMGEAGRAGFLADRMFFKEKVKIIKNEALKLFNGQE